jgi:predicted nucleotidyltransferase
MVIDLKTAESVAVNFLQDIKDTVPVNKVYLYGSYAKGTFHEDSDLDLCFFLDNIVESDTFEIEVTLLKFARKYNRTISIEPNVFPVSELDNDNPFVKEVLRTGKEVLRTGKEVLRTGKEVLRTDKEVLRTGKEVLRTGKEVLRTGKEVLRTDKEVLRTGKEVLRTGKEVLRTDKEVLGTDKEVLRMEKEIQ